MEGSAPVPQGEPDYPIDLAQAWQVRWWSKTFEITEEELRAAVAAAGASSHAVRRYLDAHFQ